VPTLGTPGTYKITLTVTNAAGNNTSGAVEIKVTG
jgi:PKD repeat protein